MSGDNDDKLGAELSVDERGAIFRIRWEWDIGERWMIYLSVVLKPSRSLDALSIVMDQRFGPSRHQGGVDAWMNAWMHALTAVASKQTMGFGKH